MEHEWGTMTPRSEPCVIVPLAGLNRAALPALAYARSLSTNVTAVHVTDEPEAAESLRRRWETWAPEGLSLVIIESPYRALVGPLLAYVRTVMQAHDGGGPVVIVLPEVVPARWYQRLLHRHTARRLRHALLHEAGVPVITVPFQLGVAAPAARQRPEQADGDTLARAA